MAIQGVKLCDAAAGSATKLPPTTNRIGRVQYLRPKAEQPQLNVHRHELHITNNEYVEYHHLLACLHLPQRTAQR